MAADSDPRSGPWTGRSGRVYVRDEGDGREGGMASILRVRPVGLGGGDSQSDAGTLLALKLAREDEPLSMDALQREVETFETLKKAQGMPPCPRLHDLVASGSDGDKVIGLVMEWCPHDMERWWAEVHGRPWAFSELCEALAEVCQRLHEYQRTCAASAGQRVAHSDVKPRNLLRAQDARWLLTDFGAAKARDLDAGDWTATRVILGTESFIAPEGLFNARKAQPEAMDIWSVGATLYALLRMHAHLRDGGRMPLNGTHSSQFRSHRVALVTDLHQRKPALFIDKQLDASQFASPDRLPDKDRTAIADALKHSFAPEHEALVVETTIALVERAMQIEPSARFKDALQMADALRSLSRLARVDLGLDATRVTLASDMASMDALAALRSEIKRPAPDFVLPRLDADDLEELGPDVVQHSPVAGANPNAARPAPSIPQKRKNSGATLAPVDVAELLGSAPDPTMSSVVPRGPGTSQPAFTLRAPAPPAAPTPTPPTASTPAASTPPPPAASAPPPPVAVPLVAAPPVASPPRMSMPPVSLAPDDASAEREKRVLVGGNARPLPLTIGKPPEDGAAGPIIEPSETRMRPPPPPALPKDARVDGVRMSKRISPRLPAWLGVGIAVLVAFQLVSIGLQITLLLISARRDTSVVATPQPALAAPVPKTGLVLVSGASAYLEQGGRRFAVGPIRPGSYTLHALPDGATSFLDIGTVEVRADESVAYACTPAGCVLVR